MVGNPLVEHHRWMLIEYLENMMKDCDKLTFSINMLIEYQKRENKAFKELLKALMKTFVKEE